MINENSPSASESQALSQNDSIKQLRENRKELERELHRVIRECVQKFKDQNGVEIKSLDVGMYMTEAIGYEPEYSVGSVSVELDL